MPRLRQSLYYNWETLRKNPWGEIAGSLGDLGSFLPIMIALTNSASGNPAISLPSTLFFSGLANVFSGAYFGVPIVVQPMSAIASIALTNRMTLKENMAAGISVAIIILVLSVTSLLHRASTIIPTPIIKGIQVGAGLSLCLNGGTTLPGWHYYDEMFWAIATFVLLYGTSRMPRFPVALVIFCIGYLSVLPLFDGPKFGFWMPFLPTVPSGADFVKGFGTAGLGQIPLTVLNSIIAVKYLSEDLLPYRPAPSITSLGMSVAMMNLVGCWFGAMPVCHGSGGLAAQHRFGARSGASVMVFGLFKIIIGLVFGDSLTYALKRFPPYLLGVMVFAAGIELISVGENLNVSAKDLLTPGSAAEAGISPSSAVFSSWRGLTEREKKERFQVMMVTAAVMVACKNAFVGFLAGYLVWAMIKFQDRMEARRYSRTGGVETEATQLLAD